MMRGAFSYTYILCLSSILVHFRFLSVKLSGAIILTHQFDFYHLHLLLRHFPPVKTRNRAACGWHLQMTGGKKIKKKRGNSKLLHKSPHLLRTTMCIAIEKSTECNFLTAKTTLSICAILPIYFYCSLLDSDMPLGFLDHMDLPSSMNTVGIACRNSLARCLALQELAETSRNIK